jgi:hypothetical protein
MKNILKNIFLTLSLFLLIFPTITSATSESEDQKCIVPFPYSNLDTINVYNNGYLIQNFVPTQNRLRYLYLQLYIQATAQGYMDVKLLDENDQELASDSWIVVPEINGANTATIEFQKDYQQYDVPLIPGKTYKIKVSTESSQIGLGWAFNYGVMMGSCDPNGSASVGGAPVSFDFGYTTSGYNYTPVKTPIYRFWSDTYHGHFYTMNASEKDFIIANDPNWKYEGSVFNAYSETGIGLSPVYRFWSDNYRHHFYTISEGEKNSIIANDPNWNYEGIAYYAFATPQFDATYLYRFWSDTYKGHFYTSDFTEVLNVVNTMPEWHYEGVAYFLPN